MNVSACMSNDVRLATLDETIREAAETMKEIDAGVLPVADNDRLVGMITDRDIAIRAVAAGLGPDTPVRQVMSKEVCYCFDDEALDAVAMQMADLQLRRLPVLNRDKRLVGIVTLGDLAQTGEEHPSAAALSGVSQASGLHNQTYG